MLFAYKDMAHEGLDQIFPVYFFTCSALLVVAAALAMMRVTKIPG